MNEQMLADYYGKLCDQLRAIQLSGEWGDTHNKFELYVADRWSLSKTRAKLLVNFSKFTQMCREAGEATPETPENISPILSLPQKMWLEVWALVRDCLSGGDVVNDRHCKAVMQRFCIYANRKIPPDVLNRMRLKRATKTIAELGDGEQLAEQLGKRVGEHFDPALHTLIDIDQAIRNE